MWQKHVHQVSNGMHLARQQNTEDVVLDPLALAWQRHAAMDTKFIPARVYPCLPHPGKLHLELI
jgi:hypothetical protein